MEGVVFFSLFFFVGFGGVGGKGAWGELLWFGWVCFLVISSFVVWTSRVAAAARSTTTTHSLVSRLLSLSLSLQTSP